MRCLLTVLRASGTRLERTEPEARPPRHRVEALVASYSIDSYTDIYNSNAYEGDLKWGEDTKEIDKSGSSLRRRW
jgi:hypothetical protein